MRKLTLSLLAAASALALQACDVDVRESSGSAASSQPATDPAGPQDATAADSTATAGGPQDATAADSSAAPASPLGGQAAGTAMDSQSAGPNTSAMGAGMGTAMPDAGGTAAGMAAPTELAQFLEEHPVRSGGAGQQSSGDDGKESATGQADSQRGASQASQS